MPFAGVEATEEGVEELGKMVKEGVNVVEKGEARRGCRNWRFVCGFLVGVAMVVMWRKGRCEDRGVMAGEDGLIKCFVDLVV